MARNPLIDEYLLKKKPGLLADKFDMSGKGLGLDEESPQDFEQYMREKKPGLLGEQFDMSGAGLLGEAGSQDFTKYMREKKPGLLADKFKISPGLNDVRDAAGLAAALGASGATPGQNGGDSMRPSLADVLGTGPDTPAMDGGDVMRGRFADAGGEAAPGRYSALDGGDSLPSKLADARGEAAPSGYSAQAGGGMPKFASDEQPETVRNFMASLKQGTPEQYVRAEPPAAGVEVAQGTGGSPAPSRRFPLSAPSAPPMVQAPDEEGGLQAQLARFDALQGQQQGEDARAGFLSGMSKIGAAIAGQNNALDFKGRNLLGSEKDRQALIKQYLADKYARGREERADKRLDQEAGYKEALTRQALAQAERAGRPTVDPYEGRAKLQEDAQENALRMKELEIQGRSGDLDKRLAAQKELAARRTDAAAAAALKKGEMKGEKAAKGRDLPAGEAATLGKLGVADSMLSDLDKAWGSGAGMTAFVSKHLPGTAATKYGDIQRATAQVVGTIMEGGKLTDADLPKYMALLPNPDDSKDRAKAKVTMLRRMLEQQRAGSLAGFESAGFNVAGFNRQPVSSMNLDGAPSPGAAQSALSADKAARLKELREKKAAGRLGT